MYNKCLMEHILRSKKNLITERNTTCHGKDIEITDFAEKSPVKIIGSVRLKY